MTRAGPVGGPVGSVTREAEWAVPHQSAHHSHTLPATSYRPWPLGGKASTGQVPTYPSSAVLRVGKRPCQMLHRCAPSGVRSSPQAYRAWWRPPRAAYSHSASVGSRPPAHAQYAVASRHETWTTGWSPRSSSPVPGPSGLDQVAPSTAHHHGASTERWEAARTWAEAKLAKTNDQPYRSASVTCPVSATKAAKSSLDTVCAAIRYG